MHLPDQVNVRHPEGGPGPVHSAGEVGGGHDRVASLGNLDVALGPAMELKRSNNNNETQHSIKYYQLQ